MKKGTYAFFQRSYLFFIHILISSVSFGLSPLFSSLQCQCVKLNNKDQINTTKYNQSYTHLTIHL